MSGRFRELCQGINVDLGTAAAFREQWAREAGELLPSKDNIPLLLKTDQAPGDTVAMTAAVYSLHQAHPGKYATAVYSPYPEVFQYNPDVISGHGYWARDSGAAELYMHYPAIHKCNRRGIHFMQGWCEFLGMALGVEVPLLTNRPRLYFPDPEPPVEDYWVICSGGKNDLTNKLWGHQRYQELVSILKGATRFVQVGNSSDEHPQLRGVEDMVGKTSLRGLFELCRRARGVVCGVSLLMHVAAALEKPAIVIAGGREPVQWNAYPKQHYLHTVGVLPCTSIQGEHGVACWRHRVLPLGDNPTLDRYLCERPKDGIPECMTLIRPSWVAELVMRCNQE